MFGIQQVTCYTIKDLNVMLIKMALSFDDTLLVPKRTFGGSRKNVDLSTIICGYKMKIPIFSANMSSVTEAKMAIAMRNHGGLGVIHRMCTPKEQYEMVNEVYCRLYEADLTHTPVFVSIEGTKDEAIERIKNIEHLYPYGYCIDVAHANSPDVEETIKAIIEEFPNINLIVGNYATPEGIMYLLDAVPDISLDRIAFKVGIGSGSQCTTRIVTGCGLPTLESIFRIRISLPNPNLKLIADGGIKNSGDIVKVLAAGANAVMLGHLLAGAKETPGNVIKYKGGLYKIYRGSASFGQKFDVGKDGFVEGEETLVSYKSQVTTTLTQLIEGVRSGCSYCGAVTLEELQENAEFVHITDSGYVESTAHGA
jgi:IMP dehydrogenase/GMP reductase